jgi:signal transduction histidine kinase
MSLPSSDARHTLADENLPGAQLPFRVPALWESWLLGFAAGCAVFVSTFAVQWFIYGYLLGHNEFHFVGVTVASILTFIFIQRMMVHSRQRRLETLRRFQIIAEMNHHIRNSLQTILYQSYTLDDEVATRLKDAVDRIQWVLERVLPAMNDDGEKRGKSPDDSSERAA